MDTIARVVDFLLNPPEWLLYVSIGVFVIGLIPGLRGLAELIGSATYGRYSKVKLAIGVTVCGLAFIIFLITLL